MPIPSADEAQLEEALRRCSPETLSAAVRYRETQDRTAIPAVVFGIIERYQPAAAAVPLADATNETRLNEDLGLDSLTLLEIVMSIEEVLGLRIANEELRGLRTLGELRQFLETKSSGEIRPAGDEAAQKRFTREEILLALPQQPPFLFLDGAVIGGDTITASYTVKGDEYFLAGHFRDEPIFPASIVFEAMGQAASLYLLEKAGRPEQKVLFASLESAHFYRKARPGDRLELAQTLLQLHEPLAIFSGIVTCAGERVAAIERLTLALDDGSSPNDSVARPASA